MFGNFEIYLMTNQDDLYGRHAGIGPAEKALQFESILTCRQEMTMNSLQLQMSQKHLLSVAKFKI